MGQSSHLPLDIDILDPHPPTSSRLALLPSTSVFFQKMHFESKRSVFWKAIIQRPCFPDVEQEFAHGVESSPSHLSAQPCYLTPAPAMAVMGPASSLSWCCV